MKVLSFNGGKQYNLLVNPREFSIIISALDYMLADIDESRMIPETLVPAAARNEADPNKDSFITALRDAERLKAEMEKQLPNWREL